MKRKRHPVSGFFAGLCLGFGLALVLMILGVVPLTVVWFAVLVLGGAVVGVVLGLVVSRTAKAGPQAAAPPAAPPTAPA